MSWRKVGLLILPRARYFIIIIIIIIMPQGSTSGPLLFNISINNLCAKIRCYEFLQLSNDSKIFRIIKSTDEFKLLQSDIDSVQKWWIENYMKIIHSKQIISFTRKTNSIHFNYFVSNLLIVRTDCVKDLGGYVR
jgi:hypothetical protein